MSDPTVVPLRRPDTIADPLTAFIAEHGRMAWQKASGHTSRARAEATIGGPSA